MSKPDADIYMKGSYIVLDFETTIKDSGSALTEENDIVLACWEEADGTTHHTWGGQYDQTELVAACTSVDFIVAHNAKFELQWLARCGIDLGTVLVFDTMLGEYVLGGNRWMYSELSLENCAQRRWQCGKDKVISYMYKAGISSENIPQSWLLKYCRKDVRLTHRLFLSQRQELLEKGQLSVAYTRNLLCPVLADIEKNGMQLDSDKVTEYTRRKEEEFRTLTNQLATITGGINTNSSKQLATFLYETLGFDELKDRKGNVRRTAGGSPLTGVDAVASLKPKNKKQREFLVLYKRHRAVSSELTKYLRTFADCCEKSGGLLKAQFNQTRTQTHRLSSSGREYGCQFQNFPRAYKHMFTARNEGWLIGEGDGAQLEFRVAGHLGRDAQIISDINNKVDIHKYTASVLNNVPTDEVTKEQRQSAKADTFAPLYGGQNGTPDQMRYYEAFRQKYSGISGAQKAWVNEVLATKVLVTEWGLRYYFPHVKMNANGYVSGTTNICNYPVQGFATAEIIPIALVYFWHLIRHLKLKMFIVNSVHDSVIAELPEDEVGIYHELCKYCLTKQVYNYLACMYKVKFTAPLGCGVSTSTHWSTGEETVYEWEVPTYAER